MIDMLDETSQEKLFRAFDAALKEIDPCTGVIYNVPVMVDGELDRASLQDAFRQLERHGLRVAHMFMNGRDYSNIRKFGEPPTGLVAYLWEAAIIVSPVVPEGIVYVCAGEKCMDIIEGPPFHLVNPWTVSVITVSREPAKPDSYADRTDNNLRSVFV